MSSRVLLIAVAALALGLAPGFAARAAPATSGKVNVPGLIQSQGCSGCHTARTKLIGPAWGWIAWRYRDKPGRTSVDEVAQFITSGGVGYWAKWTGGIPMPAHHDLSAEQVRDIARWILSRPPIEPPQSGVESGG